MLEQFLIKSADRLEDNFPIFCVRDMDEEESSKLFQSCMDSVNPINLNLKMKLIIESTLEDEIQKCL